MWQRRSVHRIQWCTGMIYLLVGPGLAMSAALPTIEDTYQEYTHAVELARSGNYAEGIRILRNLLQRFPNDYSLNRDLILILNWNKDCGSALSQFDRVSTHIPFEPYFSQAVADCAIQQAQAGQHAQALQVLDTLLQQQPEYYPWARDRAVITAWQGKCNLAVERYHALPVHAVTEKYLAMSIGDCLLELRRPRETAAIARMALASTPADEELQHLLNKAQIDLIDATQHRNELIAEISTNEDDQGLREWQQYLEVSTELAKQLRMYGRFRHSYADDPQFSRGNLHRVGLGLEQQLNEQWRARAEISGDVKQSGQSGGLVQVQFYPRDTIKITGMATNYVEDLPLRARAVGVTATQQQLTAEYTDLRDQWYGQVVLNRWKFSDNNQRQSEYAILGYGYVHQPEYEHFIYGEAYQSRNTLVGTDYFNPASDQSIGLLHRSNLIYSTDYLRHVDSLYLSIANYAQTGFTNHSTWAVKFEQNYDFDDTHHLSWSIGYGRHVYDGEVEYQNNAFVRYVWQFVR